MTLLPMHQLKTLPLLFCGLVLLSHGLARAQQGATLCGELANGFGPYDYRDYVNNKAARNDPNSPIRLVEGAHFQPQMEALYKGKNGANRDTLGGEFDYTLRAFPNHHRALDAMVRLAALEGRDQPKSARYTVECWFDRAIRFRPDDVIVRMIFSSFLAKRLRVDEARIQLETATELAKDNGFTHYNIGLLYFDLKDYGRALVQAHTAARLGMPRQDLRQRLVAIGQWRDEVAPPAPAVTASDSATPASAPQARQ